MVRGWHLPLIMYVFVETLLVFIEPSLPGAFQFVAIPQFIYMGSTASIEFVLRFSRGKMILGLERYLRIFIDVIPFKL